MRDSTVRATPVAALPRPAWLPEAVWPFDTRTLNVAGSRIAFTDVGTGPTLLFVHVGMWSFVWRDVIQRLAGRYRCIALDAPGNGLSARPAAGVSFDGAARAVAVLLDVLHPPEVTLVVHDLGGIAGVVGAARAEAEVGGIAAINAFAWRPRSLGLRAMLRVVGSRPFRELDVYTGLIPRITATSFGVGKHLDAAGRAAFLAPISRNAIRAFHDYIAEARTDEDTALEAEAALAGPFAGLPLLTIFGAHNDPFHFQAEWRRRFPAAEQHVIAGGNHFPMCDDPEFVADTIGGWRSRLLPAEGRSLAGDALRREVGS